MSVERVLRSNRLCAINILTTEHISIWPMYFRIRSIHSMLQLTHDAFGASSELTTDFTEWKGICGEKNERNNRNCIKLIFEAAAFNDATREIHHFIESSNAFRSAPMVECIVENNSRQTKMIFLLLCVPKIAATRYGQSMRSSRGREAGRKWKYVEEIKRNSPNNRDDGYYLANT